MQVFKADYERRLAIPGVPGLVARPVDIDPSRTGFTNLRSLRIYRFEAGTTIHGHAEEDEVLIVVMAGSVDLKVTGDNSGAESRQFSLSAPGSASPHPCAAYLPPNAAYELTPRTEAEVAYARATTASGNPSTAFSPRGEGPAEQIRLLLEEKNYCQRLSLRLTSIDTREGVDFEPIQESEAEQEALIHLRTVPPAKAATIRKADCAPIALETCDTVAMSPGERPILHIAPGSSALILSIVAR